MLWLFLFISNSWAQTSTVDQMHSNFSTIVRRSTNLMDQLFHDDEDKDLDVQNKSRIIFSNRTSLNDKGELENKFRLKTKIRLKNLPKKFLLTISADEDDENRSLRENSILGRDAIRDNKETSTEGSISILQELGKVAKLKLSSGIRISKSPTPRLKARLYKDLTAGQFDLNTNLEAVWNSDSGVGQKSSFNIGRKLSDYIYLRWYNEQTWFDENDIIENSFGPTLGHQLSDRRSLSYSARVQFRNRPNYQLSNYNLSIQYRQNLHRGWFHYEVGPYINFPKDKSFKRTEGVSLNLILALGGPTF